MRAGFGTGLALAIPASALAPDPPGTAGCLSLCLEGRKTVAEQKPDIARLVDEAAKAIGLPIAAEYRANVLVNYRALAGDCPAAARGRARRRADAGAGVPAMSDPLSKQATAAEIARAVMSGKAKAAAVVEAALTRIETSEARINAFTDVRGRAGEEARRRDRFRPASRAAGRRALRGQEPVRHQGPADARRLEDQPRRPEGRPRRRAGAQARGGGRHPGRRPQHGRVRLRLHRRERPLRPVAQSARSDAHDRRLVGRLRRRRRFGRGAAGAGLRHQRLDPRAVLAVRPVRAEADLRQAEPRRLLSLRRCLRPSGPARALGRGPGAVVRRHAGLGSRRSGLHRPRHRADLDRPARRHRRPAHRRRRRLFRPGRRARGAGGRRDRGQGAGRVRGRS